MVIYGKIYGNGNLNDFLVFKDNANFSILGKDDVAIVQGDSIANLLSKVNLGNTLYSISEYDNSGIFITIKVSSYFDEDDDEEVNVHSPVLKRISERFKVADPNFTIDYNTVTNVEFETRFKMNIPGFLTNYSYITKFNLIKESYVKIIKDIFDEVGGLKVEETITPFNLNNALFQKAESTWKGGEVLEISYRIKKPIGEQKPPIEPVKEDPKASDDVVATNDGADDPNSSESQDVGRGDATGEDDINSSGDEPRIPGITNIFPNTYSPQKIEMNTSAPSDSKNEIAQGIGRLPFVWYNSYQISYTDITYLVLEHNGICPTLKIVFFDSLGVMSDNGIPIDDSKIKLYIDSVANNLKAIFLEFKIVNFSVNDGLYTISGLLDLSGLYLPSYKAYKDKSSFYALQDVAKELGLGFNSNLSDTDDAMTWINPGDKVYDFIDSIVANSYKSDSSFMLGYIDYYYNFNYVDIEDELSRDIKDEVAVSTLGLEQAANVTSSADETTSLVLSNDVTFEGTNTFIEKYKIINNSTSVSLMEGYLTKTKYYNASSKELLVFDVDSISTEGNKIVMKSGDQDFYNKNINMVYNGKVDIDNSHLNFNYSNIQNDRNVVELSKLGLDTVLSTPNYNLYRFQKVNVIISAETATPSHTLVNERLSGEWFIVDIKFELINSNFYQKILLVKRELEALAGEEYQSENSLYGESNENGGSNPNDLSNTDVNNVRNSAKSSITNNTKYSEKIKPILAAFDYWKITNKYYKIAILANIKKECNLVPKYENLDYSNTDNSRIREVFGRRVRNLSEQQLTALKRDLPRFAEVIYGVNSGMGLGNDSPGDAWKYRGAGYIQLTGKANMRKYGKYANVDLLSNPSILITDANKSAIVAVGFIVKQIKNGNFSSQDSANKMVTQVVGGSGLNLNSGIGAKYLANVQKYANEFRNVV